MPTRTRGGLPPELPLITAGGFSAYADMLALEKQEVYGREQWLIWLVSLLGPQQSVRALWARLLKGELMTVAWERAHETRFATLAPQPPKSWRMHAASLPAAAAHQVMLVPRLACYANEDTPFLLFPRTPDESPGLHYRFLNRRIALPLHPSWADWLWARAITSREAVALEARGVGAYHCAPDEATITRDIAAAIRSGRLGAVDAPSGGRRASVEPAA